MVTETGFLEPKIAKMVLDPDPEHRRGQQLPDDETIYDSIDFKPTIIAAIGNFKIARELLHGSLRDGAPDLFAKVEMMSWLRVCTCVTAVSLLLPPFCTSHLYLTH